MVDWTVVEKPIQRHILSMPRCPISEECMEIGFSPVWRRSFRRSHSNASNDSQSFARSPFSDGFGADGVFLLNKYAHAVPQATAGVIRMSVRSTGSPHDWCVSQV